MYKQRKTAAEKEAIIAECLLGNLTYRAIGIKYGVDYRTIFSWVTNYRGIPMKKVNKVEVETSVLTPVDAELKQLQKELRKSKLHVELLNTMIDIAEDSLKIEIRKKSGTKQ